MSVITNVTVPVGNCAVEPTVAAPGSGVGPEIGMGDINRLWPDHRERDTCQLSDRRR